LTQIAQSRTAVSAGELSAAVSTKNITHQQTQHHQHHFRFNSRFPGGPGLASSHPSVFFLRSVQKTTFGHKKHNMGLTAFPSPNVLSNQWGKLRAPTPTKESQPLTSSFLHPPPECWRKGRCSFYVGAPMPVHNKT